jgi:hypothetical protein
VGYASKRRLTGGVRYITGAAAGGGPGRRALSAWLALEAIFLQRAVGVKHLRGAFDGHQGCVPQRIGAGPRVAAAAHVQNSTAGQK